MDKVSIVILSYNEEKNIGECLDSVTKIDYPKQDFEILVVDGGSTDSTQSIVKSFQKKNKNIRLVKNPKKRIAPGRNVGIKSAKNGFIAFTDADCTVPKDWLKKLVQEYKKLETEEKNLAGVGGSNIPPKKSGRFAEAGGILSKSFLGSLGSIQGRIFNSVQEVPSISTCNALYDKKKLLKVGGFKEDMPFKGEDYEMSLRIRRNGYKLYAIPNSIVWHKLRSTPKSFLKNMYGYGKDRMVLIKELKEFRFVYFLPLLFLIGMALTPLGFFVHQIFYLPLLYFPIIILYSMFLGLSSKKPELSSAILIGFLTLHFGYALGELVELINPRKKN